MTRTFCKCSRRVNTTQASQEGDWNLDGVFDSDDLIDALVRGRYRAGIVSSDNSAHHRDDVPRGAKTDHPPGDRGQPGDVPRRDDMDNAMVVDDDDTSDNGRPDVTPPVDVPVGDGQPDGLPPVDPPIEDLEVVLDNGRRENRFVSWEESVNWPESVQLVP